MNFELYTFHNKMDQFLDGSQKYGMKQSRSTMRNHNRTIDYQRVRFKSRQPDSYRINSTTANSRLPWTPPNQNKIRFVFSPTEMKRAKHGLFSR